MFGSQFCCSKTTVNTKNTIFRELKTVFREHQNGVLCVLKPVFKNSFQKQEPNRPFVFVFCFFIFLRPVLPASLGA